MVEIISTNAGCLSRKIRYWSSAGVYKFKIRWSLSHDHFPQLRTSLQDDRRSRCYSTCVAPWRWYIHYTMAFCWLDTIRCNSGWGIEMSQASPLTPKLKNKRHNLGSRGHLQLVRDATSLQHYCIIVIKIWEISPIYTLPQVLYLIARFILIFHYALQTQRGHVAADIV